MFDITKGPWGIEKYSDGTIQIFGDLRIISDDEERVTTVVESVTPNGSQIGNSFLIAAAPDLLEACEAHIAALGSKIRDGEDRPEYREAIYQAYTKMVAAIAKARGEA